jgi:hypothetical protein
MTPAVTAANTIAALVNAAYETIVAGVKTRTAR